MGVQVKKCLFNMLDVYCSCVQNTVLDVVQDMKINYNGTMTNKTIT